MIKPKKLNIQGLARRDKRLMEALESEGGHTFVSVDLGAGEPTVTAQYSGDENYIAACFGMVGKNPYWDLNQELLMIDDLYWMVASKSPMAKNETKELFRSGYFDTWLDDPEPLKKHPIRVFHKPQALGLGYGMGPRKMVNSAYDGGHLLLFKHAKQFRNMYWNEIFPDLKKFSEKQVFKFERDGSLVNQFGYRLIPDSPHKCFNYMIQSSVSGIINLLSVLFEGLCPWAEFICVIHDENIYSIPTDRLEEARGLMDEAVKQLNDQLGWRVDIRTGWETGVNLYEAK